MPTTYTGCSGYHYRHWRGLFYPAKMLVQRWFEFYSQHFYTLELNNTFYRFPQFATFSTWYAQSPDGFQFAVKAPQLITHYKQFYGVGQLLGDFMTLPPGGCAIGWARCCSSCRRAWPASTQPL